VPEGTTTISAAAGLDGEARPCGAAADANLPRRPLAMTVENGRRPSGAGAEAVNLANFGHKIILRVIYGDRQIQPHEIRALADALWGDVERI
jgi:hypothetical protein